MSVDRNRFMTRDRRPLADLMADGVLPDRYTASQGVCLERAGLVYLERDAAGQVWVGGDVVTCVDGHVTL